MAHNLTIRNGKADMIYARANGTPWHGLGTAFDEAPADIAATLRAAGLDYTVVTVPLFRELTDAHIFQQTKKAKMTVRQDTGAELGVVGTGYRTVQNAEAFAVLDRFIESGLVTVNTAGSLREGARAWVSCRINRPALQVTKDGELTKNLMIAQGHDGLMSIFFVTTLIDTVCENTLVSALGAESSRVLKIRHTSGALDMLTTAADAIDAVDHDLERAGEILRALSKHQVSVADVRAYIKNVFRVRDEAEAKKTLAQLMERPVTARDSVLAGRSDFQALLSTGTENDHRKVSKVEEDVTRLFETGRGADLEGRKGTAWGLMSATTEYLTWEKGRNPENRFNALVFDDKATSVRAFEEARALLAA